MERKWGNNEEGEHHCFKSIQGQTPKRLYTVIRHHIYMFAGILYSICLRALTYVTFNKPFKWNETVGIGQLLDTAAMSDELEVKPTYRVITRSYVWVYLNTVYSCALVSMCERASVSLCACLSFISACLSCTSISLYGLPCVLISSHNKHIQVIAAQWWPSSGCKTFTPPHLLACLVLSRALLGKLLIGGERKQRHTGGWMERQIDESCLIWLTDWLT